MIASALSTSCSAETARQHLGNRRLLRHFRSGLRLRDNRSYQRNRFSCHIRQVFDGQERFLGCFFIPIANGQNADPQAALFAATVHHHPGLLAVGLQHFCNAIEQRSRQDGVHPARRFAALKSENLACRAIGEKDAEIGGEHQQANRNGGDDFLIVAALRFHQRQQARDFSSPPLIQISSFHANNSLNCNGLIGQGTLE